MDRSLSKIGCTSLVVCSSDNAFVSSIGIKIDFLENKFTEFILNKNKHTFFDKSIYNYTDDLKVDFR